MYAHANQTSAPQPDPISLNGKINTSGTLQAAAWWQKHTGKGPVQMGTMAVWGLCFLLRARQTWGRLLQHNTDHRHTQDGPDGPLHKHWTVIMIPLTFPSSPANNGFTTKHLPDLGGYSTLDSPVCSRKTEDPTPRQMLPSNTIPFSSSSPHLKATSHYLWNGSTFTRQTSVCTGAEHPYSHMLNPGHGTPVLLGREPSSWGCFQGLNNTKYIIYTKYTK